MAKIVDAKMSGKKTVNMSNREPSVQEMRQADTTECVGLFIPSNLRERSTSDTDGNETRVPGFSINT